MRYNTGLALDALGMATSFANYFRSIALTTPFVRIFLELRPDRPLAIGPLATSSGTSPSRDDASAPSPELSLDVELDPVAALGRL